MSHKPRPDNGPGSNGLRGGIKTFSAKTTTGPWMEEYGGPALYKRGFTTSDYLTEAQFAQLGTTSRSAGFGAGLPLTEVVKHKSTSAELFNPLSSSISEESRWKTNSQLMSSSINIKKNPMDTMLTPKLSRDKLEDYRKNWTSDSEVGRKFRFQTESRLAGNAVNGKFQVNCLRFLPGTPKSLEVYRSRLVDRFGIFAVSAVKHHVGKGQISCAHLRNLLQECGVDVKPFEFNQIIAFITPSADTVDAEEFVRVLRGSLDGFPEGQVNEIFNQLSRNTTQISLRSVENSINKTAYPEVMEGFTCFMAAYSFDGENLTQEEFSMLHRDLYTSLPNKFAEVLRAIWTPAY